MLNCCHRQEAGVVLDTEMRPLDPYEYVPFKRIVTPSEGTQLDISEEYVLICKHVILGMHLQTKRWDMFPVRGVELVTYDWAAFGSLILAPDTKKTLGSLVRLQDRESPQFDDVIIGKGKGLIILLHGSPGVGETFTAGCTPTHLSVAIIY
ncbi:hypothetical protein VTL71DRAFT_3569 [Oculimacula yallundae]|uniref:Uncharacterized protein n=1 Tax=Oculimacula yallundae TaxID=86028 RepID=A0ABR4C9H4_9HELO